MVENKGGAAGNLGAQIAARAPADGYTWVYSATPMATNMRMYRKPGYDVMKEVPAGGGTVTYDLPASIEGVFEAELEGRGEQIIQLTVEP